jgi:hypothetical protein
MVIDSTTLTGNSAAYFGAGICTFGTLALSNSTFTGDTPDNLFGSYDDGGGNVFG